MTLPVLHSVEEVWRMFPESARPSVRRLRPYAKTDGKFSGADVDALLEDMGRAAKEDAERRRLAEIKTRVYFVRCGDFIKIGYAISPEQRLADLQVGCPHTLVLIGSMPGTPLDEEYTHHLFREDRERGEWFRVSDRLLAFIAERCQ